MDAAVDMQARSGQPGRRIVLCADDYGLAPGVDHAIRSLILRGRLSATSVMVVTPTFDQGEAAALAVLNTGMHRADIGLHLTLTAPHVPLSQGFRPLQAGAFPPLAAMLGYGLFRRLDPIALADEIRAQLKAFATAFGRPPDFVDGHQHVQLLPQVSDALIAALGELAPRAWIRQCGRVTSLARRLGDRKGILLDLLSRRLRRHAMSGGIAVNPAFAGTYDFTASKPFAARFSRFLEALPDGAVIMCHPGTVDDELKRLDPLTTQREEEFAYFGGADFPALLAREGISLS